jgi:hypothetical protein
VEGLEGLTGARNAVLHKAVSVKRLCRWLGHPQVVAPWNARKKGVRNLFSQPNPPYSQSQRTSHILSPSSSPVHSLPLLLFPKHEFHCSLNGVSLLPVIT